ncbi:uncharacterized protein LOC142635114 [Castanea sativa]|uniref:uncharacterized protein LOC142635114 n=1 Tax=Castanea sativa TaxID=21020 RepID=UPI003F651DF3
MVTLRIGGHDVKKVLVDQGSGAEIMYLDLYKGLKLKPEDLTCYDSLLAGFDGKIVISNGQIRLPIQARSEVVEVDFIVVDAYSPYTAIMALDWRRVLDPCREEFVAIKESSLVLESNRKGAKCEELEKIVIDDDEKKFFQVRIQLPPWEKKELIVFLRKNVDVFALSAYKAPRVDPSFICHHLNVNPAITLKKQPHRRSSKEHSNAINEEEYHQIPLALNDQEKTAFVTPIGNYYYKVMPFRLKNTRSTYQRMTTRMFEPQLGKNIEVYIDDMVVKNKVESEHKPVYYVSKSLHEAEVHYLPLEKVILVIVHATRKLPYYFQAHTVVILTQLPVQLLLRKADYTGRIAKWGTILGAFDIKYVPRTSVKGQVLADLVAEFTKSPLEVDREKQLMDEKSIEMVSLQGPLSWRVYIDGVANHRGSGIGLVVISPKGITIEKSLRLGFSATNNEVEYEALLVGIAMVQKMGGRAVNVFSDSRLVVSQVKGELEAKDLRMQRYLNQVRHLQSRFESFTLQQIPRSRNTHVDSLATLATSSVQSLPRVILVEDLCKPT